MYFRICFRLFPFYFSSLKSLLISQIYLKIYSPCSSVENFKNSFTLLSFSLSAVNSQTGLIKSYMLLIQKLTRNHHHLCNVHSNRIPSTNLKNTSLRDNEKNILSSIIHPVEITSCNFQVWFPKTLLKPCMYQAASEKNLDFTFLLSKTHTGIKCQEFIRFFNRILCWDNPDKAFVFLSQLFFYFKTTIILLYIYIYSSANLQ